MKLLEVKLNNEVYIVKTKIYRFVQGEKCIRFGNK